MCVAITQWWPGHLAHPRARAEQFHTMELFAQAASQTAVEQKAIKSIQRGRGTHGVDPAQLGGASGRAQDAAEYQQRLHAMESHFEAELNGRRRSRGRRRISQGGGRR